MFWNIKSLSLRIIFILIYGMSYYNVDIFSKLYKEPTELLNPMPNGNRSHQFNGLLVTFLFGYPIKLAILVQAIGIIYLILSVVNLRKYQNLSNQNIMWAFSLSPFFLVIVHGLESLNFSSRITFFIIAYHENHLRKMLPIFFISASFLTPNYFFPSLLI